MTSTSGTLLTPVDLQRDHCKGGSSPEVTMVIYGDFECPYTRLAHHALQSIEPRLEDRLRSVFRHFPLIDKHPHAEVAAETAEAAAAQGSYWPMHDLMFHRQKALEPLDLRQYAQELGLDIEHYDTSLADRPTLASRIAQDVASGQRSGVHATPTILIDDVLYEGSREPNAMLDALETSARSIS